MLLMWYIVKERQNNTSNMSQTNVQFNIIKSGVHLSSLAMLRTASVRNFINCLTCIRLSRWTEDGPDSSVGIATGYGLDGPGIE
jgi:hypothetical protein